VTAETFRASCKVVEVIDGKRWERIATIVIGGDRWWDCKEIAVRHFGCDPGDIAYEKTIATAAVETRWVGSDAGAYPNRHMEFRKRNGQEYGPWKDLSEYAP
jgi:hypothetical protein